MITAKDLLTRARLLTQIACLSTGSIVLLACLLSKSSSVLSGFVLSSPFFIASYFEYKIRLLISKSAQLIDTPVKELNVFTCPYARLPYYSEKYAFITSSARKTYTDHELNFHLIRNMVSRQTWSPFFTWCLIQTIIFSGYSFLRNTVGQFISIPEQAEIYLQLIFLGSCFVFAFVLTFILETIFDRKTIIRHEMQHPVVLSYLTKLQKSPNDFTVGIPFLQRLTLTHRLRNLNTSNLFPDKQNPTSLNPIQPKTPWK